MQLIEDLHHQIDYTSWNRFQAAGKGIRSNIKGSRGLVRAHDNRTAQLSSEKSGKRLANTQYGEKLRD